MWPNWPTNVTPPTPPPKRRPTLARIADAVDRPLYRGAAETAHAWASLAVRAARAWPPTPPRPPPRTSAPLDYPVLTARAELALGLALEGRDPARRSAGWETPPNGSTSPARRGAATGSWPG